MSVEELLRDVLERAAANGPSSATAYERFRRRQRRRGLLSATATSVAVAAVLAAAVVLSVVVPEPRGSLGPGPAPSSGRPGGLQGRYQPGPRQAAIRELGFEVSVPAGWLVADLGGELRLRPRTEPRAEIQVSTILLPPQLGPGRGQFYPATTRFFGIGFHTPLGPYSYSRRPDGRRVLLAGPTHGTERTAYVAWPYYCRPGVRCAPITKARTLRVRSYSPAAIWPEVRRVGEAIVRGARPITNGLPGGDSSGVRPPCTLDAVIEGVELYDLARRPDVLLTVRFLNSSLGACRLYARLQVVVRDGRRPVPVPGGQQPLLVEGDLPEGSADPTGAYQVTWRWTNWCGARSVRASIEAVGASSPQLRDQRASPPRCLDRARPSRLDVFKMAR